MLIFLNVTIFAFWLRSFSVHHRRSFLVMFNNVWKSHCTERGFMNASLEVVWRGLLIGWVELTYVTSAFGLHLDSCVLNLVKTSSVMMILTLLGIQTSEVSLLSQKFYLPCTLVSIVGAHSEIFKISKNACFAKWEISENKDHEGLSVKKLENMI